MPRIRRNRIALFLSLLMTALLLCQGMAQAMAVGAALPASQQTSQQVMPGMSCHESAPDAGKAQAVHTSDCQHLDKATDSSAHLLAALDHFTPVVAFLLPAPSADVGAIALSTLAPVPPDPNPPATLRFHRFRE